MMPTCEKSCVGPQVGLPYMVTYTLLDDYFDGLPENSNFKNLRQRLCFASDLLDRLK